MQRVGSHRRHIRQELGRSKGTSSSVFKQTRNSFCQWASSLYKFHSIYSLIWTYFAICYPISHQTSHTSSVFKETQNFVCQWASSTLDVKWLMVHFLVHYLKCKWNSKLQFKNHKISSVFKQTWNSFCQWASSV